MKRLIALAIALILALSMTAIAEESRPDFYAKYPQYNVAAKDSGAELNVLIVYNSANFTSFEDWWWWQFMESATGVKVVPTLVEQSVYNEQLAIIMSSGEMPDIIWRSFSNAEIADYGMNQGAFVALNDYVLNPEVMPRLSSFFEQLPEMKAASTCSDGNIYGLPIIKDKNYNMAAVPIWENTWLEAAGIDGTTIITLDDMYKALKAAVAVDYNGNGEADEVGWSSFWGTDGKDGMRSVVKNILVAYGIASNEGILAVDIKNDVGGFAVTMEGYYETLQFLNKLYVEGLLDNDLFSQSETDLVGKMSNNQMVFSTYFNPGYFPAYVEFNNNAFWDHKLVWQTPFVANAADTPIAPVAGQNNVNTAVITSSCKDVELAAKWLDVCYDPMVAFYYYVGAEFGSEDDFMKVGYNYNAEEYKFHWDLGKAATGREGMNDMEYLCKINSIEGRGFCGLNDGYFINLSEEGKGLFPGRVENYRDWNSNYYEEIADYHVSYYPDVYFNEEQLGLINDLSSDVETFIIENTAKFISGEIELTEENWNSFLTRFDQMGGTELNAMYADAYAAYIANA